MNQYIVYMKKYVVLCLLCCCSVFVSMAQSSWELRLMPEIAFGGKNVLQCPNTVDGTRVPLDQDFDRRRVGVFSPRVELEYVYKRNHFILTAAWLTDKFEGISVEDIRFNGTTFDTGSSLLTTYRFDTYRIGYRYRIVARERFDFELGATLLVRDASITMNDYNRPVKFTNVGVAPLISYRIGWNPSNRITVLSYGDGFAVKQGRAIDVYAGIKYQFNNLLSANLGYRLLDGGSDVESIYTMALYQYLSFGIGLRIGK